MNLFNILYRVYSHITGFHRLYCLSTISVWLGCTAAFAETLPLAVSDAIQRSPVQPQSISLWIAPADGGAPIVDLNSQTPRTPASVTKVFTTGVGLMALGDNYRWHTEFYTDGHISNKSLTGNLYIKGYGDPYLVQESLMEMVIALRERGIDRIDGDIVLDNSYFITKPENPDLFDGHGQAPYNAIPHALSINFRTITLLFDVRNGRPVVTSEAKLAYTTIQNNMTINKAKKCRGRGFSPRISVDRSQDSIVVSGAMSARCKNKKLSRVLTDAGDLFYGHFKSAWEKTGGQMHNKWYYGKINKNLKLLHRAPSRPLSEQVAAMNKNSNNLMTRQLFLTIGAELTKPPATLEKSRAVVLNVLRKLGVPMQGLFIDNGSGLSRQTRFSAAQMGAFLLAIQRSPVKPFFERSLSIAGVDGTLRKRLRNTPLAGNAIGKTGTLKQAKSLAGYLTTSSGKKYVYVMLFQGPKARSGRVLMDELLQWLYTQ